MPKVSIGIPTFNSQKFLAQAIESVLQQTDQDFELIISDDNSTDQTDKIVEFYAQKDRRIRYFKNATQVGLFKNFNRCIEYSSGEYINIMGHDDVMHRCNIAAKIAIFEAFPQVGLVTSSVEIINAQGDIIDLGWGQYTKDQIINGREWVLEEVTAYNPICCPFVFLRRTAIEKAGLFSCRYPFVGDFEMWLRVAMNSDVAFLKEVLGYFRWHQTNESQKYDGLYHLTEVSQVWDEMIDLLNLSDVQLQVMEERILRGLFDHFVLSHLEHPDPDYALKMSQTLDHWRQKERKISLAVESLRKEFLELKHLSRSFEAKNQLISLEKQCLTAQVQNLQEQIKAMESSKFWQIRKQWFKLKNLFRLNNE